MSAAAEIYGLFGFKTKPGEETKLRDFVHMMGDLNMTSVAAALGLGTAGVAMTEFAGKAATTAQQLQNLHLYTGVPIKEIQQWENFAETMGVAKSEVDSFFISVKKRVGEMSLTGEGLGLMQALGINPTEKDPEKMFMNIRHAMQRANADQKMALQDRLQISQGMASLMNLPMTDEDFLKKVHSMNYLTEEQNNNWAKLGQTWRAVAQDGYMLMASLGLLQSGLQTVGQYLEVVLKSFTLLTLEAQNFLKTFKPGDLVPAFMTGAGQAAGAVTPGAVQTNHISITLHGVSSPESMVKKVEEVVAKVVKDAFYKDPGSRR